MNSKRERLTNVCVCFVRVFKIHVSLSHLVQILHTRTHTRTYLRFILYMYFAHTHTHVYLHTHIHTYIHVSESSRTLYLRHMINVHEYVMRMRVRA